MCKKKKVFKSELTKNKSKNNSKETLKIGKEKILMIKRKS